MEKYLLWMLWHLKLLSLITITLEWLGGGTYSLLEQLEMQCRFQPAPAQIPKRGVDCSTMTCIIKKNIGIFFL